MKVSFIDLKKHSETLKNTLKLSTKRPIFLFSLRCNSSHCWSKNLVFDSSLSCFFIILTNLCKDSFLEKKSILILYLFYRVGVGRRRNSLKREIKLKLPKTVLNLVVIIIRFYWYKRIIGEDIDRFELDPDIFYFAVKRGS